MLFMWEVYYLSFFYCRFIVSVTVLGCIQTLTDTQPNYLVSYHLLPKDEEAQVNKVW